MPQDKTTARLRVGISYVWSKRYVIVGIVLGSLVIVIAGSFLVGPRYKAQVIILPEMEKSKLAGLARGVDLGIVSALNPGEGQVSKLYPTIVRSANILESILYSKYQTEQYPDSVSLVEYWRISAPSKNREFEVALKELRGRLETYWDVRLETVTITVEMEEAALAAEVANRVTAELDRYTRLTRKTNASAQRDFVEHRIVEVEKELAGAENALRDFKEKNRRILDSPQLMLELARLERNVQIKSAVYLELKKQFEVARIEEIKNIPVINVLDPARVPADRDRPRRAELAITTFVLMLCLSVLGVALWSLYGDDAAAFFRDVKGKKAAQT
jgi:uncharacterized protein involved in exopolysaccharide biosynthesis